MLGVSLCSFENFSCYWLGFLVLLPTTTILQPCDVCAGSQPAASWPFFFVCVCLLLEGKDFFVLSLLVYFDLRNQIFSTEETHSYSLGEVLGNKEGERKIPDQSPHLNNHHLPTSSTSLSHQYTHTITTTTLDSSLRQEQQWTDKKVSVPFFIYFFWGTQYFFVFLVCSSWW